MHLPSWLSPPLFEQEDQTRLAKNLANLLWIIGLFEIILGFLTPWLYPEVLTIPLLVLGSSLVITLGCYWLMLKRQLVLASLLICVFLSVATLGTPLISNGINSLTIPTYTVVLLIAGLLLGSRASFFFSILGGISVILIYGIETTGLLTIPQTTFPEPVKIVIPILAFILAATLLHDMTQNQALALQKVKQNEAALKDANIDLITKQTLLEQHLESRTTQLHASIAIGQTISNLLTPDELGQQFIQKFSTLFPYDFAGIYLLDETGRWASLKYSNLDSSLFLQGEPPRFDLTLSNSITYAIRSQRAFITSDFSKSSEFFTLLQPSNLRTEITIPLQTRGKLLGAINLQTYQEMIFNSQEVENLQNIANQMASAFENGRLFHETQKQLQEINRLNQFYLQTTWRAVLTEETPAYQFSTGEIKEMKKPDEAVLEIAQETRKIHLSGNDGQSTLIAPIMFQDQVLGAIQLTTPNRVWTPDEMTLIETVLNQTALSLENTRLIIETRSRAEQEKMISEISNRMRETLDLETILQTTAQDIQKTFKLSEVEVRLLSPEKRDTSEFYMSISGE